MMLYSKIEENAHIQRKLDQALLQNQIVMTQILALGGQTAAATSAPTAVSMTPDSNPLSLLGMPQMPVANNNVQGTAMLNLLQQLVSQNKPVMTEAKSAAPIVTASSLMAQLSEAKTCSSTP